MCKGNEAAPTLQWQLQQQGQKWRLAVHVESMPELELAPEALRLRRPGAQPLLLPVPEEARPLDPDNARCTFSRARGRLLVEWPCGTAEPAASEATPTAESAVEADAAEADAKSEEPSAGAVESSVETEEAEEAEETKLTAEEWRAKGNEAVKAGEFEEGIRCYAAGLGESPEAEAAVLLHSNRSLCFHKLGRQQEAVEDSKCCVALKPDFVKGYLRGATALKAASCFEEALAFLKRCPRNDEAANLVVELRPLAEEAEKQRLASLGGVERLKEEGNGLFKKGLFEQALEKYSKALEECEDEDSAMALVLRNNRAACSHQLSDYGAVAKDASFVLEREPNNIKALVRRMLAYEPLERYEAALQDARAVLRQEPRHEAANKLQHRLGKVVRDLQRSGA